MASLWYFRKNDRNFGPITSMVLRQFTEAGIVNPEDLVRKKGIHKWSQAKFVKNLYWNGTEEGAAEKGKEPSPDEPYVEYADTEPAPPVAMVAADGKLPPSGEDPFAALLGQTSAGPPAGAVPAVALDDGSQEDIPQALTIEPETVENSSDVDPATGVLPPESEVPRVPAPRRLRSANKAQGHNVRLATSVFAGSASRVLSENASSSSPMPPVRRREAALSRTQRETEEAAYIEEYQSNATLKWLLIAAIGVMLLGIGIVIFLLMHRSVPAAGTPGEERDRSRETRGVGKPPGPGVDTGRDGRSSEVRNENASPSSPEGEAKPTAMPTPFLPTE